MTENLRPDRCINANKLRRFEDTAHFPGSGPQGRTCSECSYLDMRAIEACICTKVASLRNIKPDKVRPIYKFTSACKYFEERKNAPRTVQPSARSQDKPRLDQAPWPGAPASEDTEQRG